MATGHRTDLLERQGHDRHGKLGLTDEDVLQIYEAMLLARRLDERMWILNRGGQASFVISCQGQEAAQVGAAWALDRERDWVYPYYRDVGLVLVLGVTPRELMLALLGKAEDPASGGRQMPNHFSSPERRIAPQSSVVGTQIPQAAGTALASKIRGDGAVTLVTFGEGATAEGDFHEGLNFAAIHKVPAVFLCENNRYAISVPVEKEVSVPDVADRALAYGIPGVAVDGNDPLEVYRATREAVERARAGEGPTLIEAKTYRLLAHSSDDDDSGYRPREEVEAWKKKDPIPRFAAYLKEQGLIDHGGLQAMEERIRQIVDDATDYAEQAPYPRAEHLLDHVYGD
ncbi:thiamine pyrophosphate-dependent dehydrogenase E1 component subunit alpha [Limnochorda pilosa]|uniref:2-oxoisovalerate dehydrogenase subunit alpha n=1 Tax=Limnochorda pilosa TaxID=1555112 RepID=A0A0K2SHX8_LIMPI|nr:thiamine pyrophosphate-dependent dehydrogenase E1 component subunit alpha [Limnochorda pilosa]BAS26680.1 2-oxoisovalerate dehydrogenase [Limnochorda pilosa]